MNSSSSRNSSFSDFKKELAGKSLVGKFLKRFLVVLTFLSRPIARIYSEQKRNTGVFRFRLYPDREVSVSQTVAALKNGKLKLNADNNNYAFAA